MSKLTICRGIPASGKTTWSKSEALQTGAIRISRDDIRHELYGVFWGDTIDENVVTKIQHGRIRDLLANGFDVIVDDTNLRARNVKRFYELGADEIAFKDFEITLEEALRRDANRARQVGGRVIQNFYAKFITHPKALPPIPEPVVRQGGFKPYQQRGLGLPHAIIVDIDGTLAHMNGRGPYDSHLAHTDTVDEVVAGMIEDYQWSGGEQEREIVLLSGRPEDDRQVTEDWLNGNAISYSGLFMRPSGDKRDDSIVKDELFEKHVAPKWNIDYAIDDRDRVVAMWRSKGLKCFQAAPGAF
ncbi:polynucleotide kinase [Clavibacter phage CN1A]|uniref:PseT polynucleotide 5'-kinase and 3'-phosphatase n=1 Tax=Clavibacter phage CN1A TaxID=1406793 RepID=U5PXF7_9CAUD|nr:polynucleotide kinase [Clavibacter phage CN1A]AGY47133.1 PseT polynucleotide 5'-kinase and 3'-phosphatase [Clavibacter phage CN1A]